MYSTRDGQILQLQCEFSLVNSVMAMSGYLWSLVNDVFNTYRCPLYSVRGTVCIRQDHLGTVYFFLSKNFGSVHFFLSKNLSKAWKTHAIPSFDAQSKTA